jgi:small conductance mechanosensitive channel
VKNFQQMAEHWLSALLSHEWAWRLLVGLSVLVAGSWLARMLSKMLDRLLQRFEVEPILRNFMRNMVYAIALVIIVVAALDFAGVPTTSLLAVVGAAGLGIGLALKDSLSNIASGVMLIVLRPFRIGDSVQIAGLEGVVDSVRIFQTRMHTFDSREIILPNSQITALPIINYTVRGERRIDIPLAMAFGDDLKSFRETLLAIAVGHPKVKSAPAPDVLVTEIGVTTASVRLRAWVPAVDYAKTQADLLEAILVDVAQRRARFPLSMQLIAGQPADP